MARFQKGQSGNPGGRPSNVVKTADVRAAVMGHAPAILKKLIELAKAGDVQAAKTILDRVVAPLKATEPPISLDIKKTWPLKKQAQAIQQAAYAGEINVHQAAALMANLATQVRIIEASELEERLANIEKSLEKR